MPEGVSVRLEVLPGFIGGGPQGRSTSPGCKGALRTISDDFPWTVLAGSDWRNQEWGRSRTRQDDGHDPEGLRRSREV